MSLKINQIIENGVLREMIEMREFLRNKQSNLRKGANLRLGYIGIWNTPMFLHLEISRIEKRSMLTWARNIMYRGSTNIPKNTRGFATWHTTFRGSEPIANKNPPPMEIDAETGYEIMRPTDSSGMNHILLNQWDKASKTYYVIRGSFTTSPSPYKNKPPVFISDWTLEGKPKHQYLHIYDQPRLLRIEHTVGMDITTMFLPPNPEIDKLIRKYSIAGLEILGPTS